MTQQAKMSAPIAWGFCVFVLIGYAGAATELQDTRRDYTNQLAVFPGAQGYGSITPAGRGGKIFRVTTLADKGPGSLREALTAKGPRTVVFEIAGTIALADEINVFEPYLTIVGQTAPSPGITLRNVGLRIRTHDVLIQHIRIRVGDDPIFVLPWKRSGLCIDATPKMNIVAYNVIIDHCSVSWGIDENFATWDQGVHDVTFSHCLIAEGLANAGHFKGEHSKGLLIGDHSKRVTVIGNLFAHNTERNPYVKGDVSAIVANNLIYNPGVQAIHLGDYTHAGPYAVDLISNVMIPGPNTPPNLAMIRFNAPTPTGSLAYLKDNLVLNELDTNHRPLITAWFINEIPLMSLKPLTLRPADQVKEWVLQNAGARPADRDTVDNQVIQDVKNGTGKIIDSPKQIGDYPEIPAVSRPLQLPENPNADDNHDGYTNLEEFLHAEALKLESPPAPSDH